ncbi:hypothetical protein AMTRI_Chr13g120910 [Amborella trichopoda]
MKMFFKMELIFFKMEWMKILFPILSPLYFFFHSFSVSTLTYSNIFSYFQVSLKPFLHLQQEINGEKAKQGQACCLNFSWRERIGINFDFMGFLD